MANTTLTADIIAKEAVMILENSLVMAKKVYRGYESEFDKKVNGYEVGETISIRRPADFEVTDGATMNVQDVVEGKLSLTVNTRKHIAWKFTSQDLTMKIGDLGDRVMKPALVQLANKIDKDVMALYKKVPNWVGTPGEKINSFADFSKMPERLDEFAVPQDDLSAVLSPSDHWGLLGSQTALFIQDAAKGAYRSASLGMIGGVDTYMSQNVPTHTVGAHGGTPLVKGASQNVTYDSVKNDYKQSLSTDGWTASIGLKAGDVFTIADVYAVNPIGKEKLSFLRQFVILEDVTTNASTSTDSPLSIYPPIITSGPFQTVDSVPANDAAITMVGTASTGYRQNMTFHKNAFTLAMVPLVAPPGAVDVGRRTHKGITVRVIPVYDGVSDESRWRLDVLYGVQAIDPRLAVRGSGTA